MMTWTLIALLVPPLVGSTVAAVVRPFRRSAGWATVACAAVSLAAATRLCAQAGAAGWQSGGMATGLWQVDALSAFLALAIAFVALLASAVAPGLERDGDEHPVDVRRLRVLMGAFAFTMLMAVTVQNVALM